MVNIDDMPAGPEMDVLIAMRVMGGDLRTCGRNVGEVSKYEELQGLDFLPSTNIAHAWEVVERIKDLEVADFGGVGRFEMSRDRDEGHWAVGWFDNIAKGKERHACDDSLPLAICRAALKAMQ